MSDDITAVLTGIGEAYAALAAWEAEHWTEVQALCTQTPVLFEDLGAALRRVADHLEELPLNRSLVNDFSELAGKADEAAKLIPPEVIVAQVEAVADRGVRVTVVRLPQVHDTEKQGLVTPTIAVWALCRGLFPGSLPRPAGFRSASSPMGGHSYTTRPRSLPTARRSTCGGAHCSPRPG